MILLRTASGFQVIPRVAISAPCFEASLPLYTLISKLLVTFSAMGFAIFVIRSLGRSTSLGILAIPC